MLRQYAEIDAVRIVLGVKIFPACDLSDIAHSLHEENSCKEHAYFDGNNEIENYGKYKRDEQYHDITLGRALDELHESSPSAHVVSDLEKDSCDAGHRNELRVRHEEHNDDKKCYRVNHACDRCAAAVLDVCSSPRDGACSRNTS